MIGDLLADVQAAALASDSFRASGSLGPWLAQQLAEFRRLPASLDSLCTQADAVARVLAERGAATTPAGQSVQDAYRLAQSAKAAYPAASLKVDQVTAAIAPVMPKVYAGVWDADVIGALLRSGVDVVSAVHTMTDLIGKRDEAQRLLQEAVTNPGLPSDTRDAAWSAMSRSDVAMTAVRIGAFLLTGYVVVKAIKAVVR